MEKVMEMGAGDAGSWTLMSCSIFWELGNGEMDCQLGVDLGHPCSFILALSRWVQPCNLMQLTLWQSNGVYNPIYLGCQDFLSTRILPVHPAAGSIIPANRCMIRDGAADGELV